MYIIRYQNLTDCVIKCESFQVDWGPFLMEIHSFSSWLSIFSLYCTWDVHALLVFVSNDMHPIHYWHILQYMGKCFCFALNTFAFPTYGICVVFCHIWLGWVCHFLGPILDQNFTSSICYLLYQILHVFHETNYL